MADIKKYVGQEALQQVVVEVKAADAAVEQRLKDYCDNKDKNFDASGSAATAEANSKAYTDEKIAPLATTEAVDGKVTAEADRAKAEEVRIVGLVEAVDGKANKNAEDIATINDETNGILAQAKADATEKANAVQTNVDALNEKVGNLPEGTNAKDVVDYVNIKTAGIATDAALGELQSQLSGVQGEVAGIKGDYLKAADKTELSDAIGAEKTRAEGVEAGLRTDVDAIKGDYLKAADKAELQGNIDTVSEGLAAVKEDVDYFFKDALGDTDVQQYKDTLKEIQDYMDSDASAASEMAASIKKNADDINAVEGRVGVAEGKITTLEGEMDAVEGAVATKAEQSALEEAIETLEGADSALDKRLKTVEAQLGDGENSVSDLIATAKQEAITAATEASATDATTKANTAETNAKAHADSLNTAMNTRVEALEAVDHEHANKAELDLIAIGDKAKWDEATGKAHEHANKAELDKIAEGDVAKWNAAETNAKAHADNLNTAMATKVDGIDARVTANAEAIAEKADADNLSALAERVTTVEAGIATNTAAIASFVPYTADEISAMFK